MSRLTVERLWKSYGDRTVLERVNLEVAAGSFVAIVGASGCGKSTLLRVLLGQERPSRGRVLLDGRPAPPEPGPDRGVVFQRHAAFPHLRALENVTLGLEFAGGGPLGRLFGAPRRRARERAAAMLDAVGLGGSLDAWPAALSGGMLQRLALAQALVLEPRVLLLDEPFGALDPGTRLDMHGLLRRLWRRSGMTVLMVTHDLKEAFALGTRVVALDKARVDPHAPDAWGATIVYDLPGRSRPVDAEGEPPCDAT